MLPPKWRRHFMSGEEWSELHGKKMFLSFLKWLLELWGDLCSAQSSFLNYFDHRALLDSGHISSKVLQTILLLGIIWCFQNYLLNFSNHFPQFEKCLWKEWLSKDPNSLEFLCNKIETTYLHNFLKYSVWGKSTGFFTPLFPLCFSPRSVNVVYLCEPFLRNGK